MEYIDKAKKFIFEPSKAFDKEKKKSSDAAFKYLVVMSFVMAVIFSIVVSVSAALVTPFIAMMGIPMEAMAFTGFFVVVTFFSILIGTIVGSIIWALWLHLWAYLLGARKGIDQTFKSVFYGITPNYFLAWIPLINILVAIWTFVLTGMGLKRLHGITTGKAAAIIIISIIIPFLIVLSIVGIAITAFGPGMFNPEMMTLPTN